MFCSISVIVGELLALTYEDIDLEKRCITINKSYQRLNGIWADQKGGYAHKYKRKSEK